MRRDDTATGLAPESGLFCDLRDPRDGGVDVLHEMLGGCLNLPVTIVMIFSGVERDDCMRQGWLIDGFLDASSSPIKQFAQDCRFKRSNEGISMLAKCVVSKYCNVSSEQSNLRRTWDF